MKPLLLFLILIPISAWSQDSTQFTANRFSIGLTFSPDYCYRFLKSNSGYDWITESRNDHEIPKFGYTAGASLSYKYKKNMQFESGLFYSNKGYSSDWSDLIFLDEDFTQDSVKLKSTYIFHYIDIPLKMNYMLIDRKFKLFITAGVSANVFLSQQTRWVTEFRDGITEYDKTKGDRRGFHAVDLAFLAGLGAEYKFSKKLRLHLEPLYRQSLISFMDSSIKGYFYSFGINSGVYYSLGQ
jgi:opacity protein-like surface antigen